MLPSDYKCTNSKITFDVSRYSTRNKERDWTKYGTINSTTTIEDPKWTEVNRRLRARTTEPKKKEQHNNNNRLHWWTSKHRWHDENCNRKTTHWTAHKKHENHKSEFNIPRLRYSPMSLSICCLYRQKHTQTRTFREARKWFPLKKYQARLIVGEKTNYRWVNASARR